MRWHVHWEKKQKVGPFSRLTIDFHAPLMGFDDGFDQAQTQSKPTL